MMEVLKYKEFVNESLNEGKEDMIAKKYDAMDISDYEPESGPNEREIEKLIKSKKFNYIINSLYVRDNGDSFDGLKKELTKAGIKFTELKDDTTDGDDQLLF